ncbi:MAG: FtsX-like permease family protein [Gammaproteobacteria bacterium]|nr:FtsX-like permease family protein [Gammaproteobacteria bacterium]
MFLSIPGIFKLALKNYLHDWQSSSGLVLALASILGPMMIVFGIKYGVISGMITNLVEEPRNREITAVYSGRYSEQWFEELGKLPSADFLVPRTRRIAATIDLKSSSAPRILHTELIPTKRRDPLLPKIVIPENSDDWLIVSESAARKLAVNTGDSIDASISRRYRGKLERVHLTLRIAAIAPIHAFERDGAFASVSLLQAVEAYRDGLAVEAFGWEGDQRDIPVNFTGFRLFARSIYDVADLKRWFNEQGIEVSTRFHEISTVQRMNENLTTIYWAIAVIGLVGFSMALGASLWVDIERKRKELSVLRLVGYSTMDITCFPLIQSMLTALLGWVLAVIFFHLVAAIINYLMLSELQEGRQVCYLSIEHYFQSFLLTCGAAFLVTLTAGLRYANIEPAEGLRDR